MLEHEGEKKTVVLLKSSFKRKSPSTYSHKEKLNITCLSLVIIDVVCEDIVSSIFEQNLIVLIF